MSAPTMIKGIRRSFLFMIFSLSYLNSSVNLRQKEKGEPSKP